MLIQVRAFEKEGFRLFREDTSKLVEHWCRFTDGCGAQFRSQFCNRDLREAPVDLQLKSASFNYFEANEGKNISDAVGSIAKCAWMRAVSRKAVEGVTNASEVVDVINAHLNKKMPHFSIFKAVAFPSIERIPASEREGLGFDNIMTAHSIVARQDGLIANQLTCLDCTTSTMCPVCKEEDPVIQYRGNSLIEEEERDDTIFDVSDDGQTDGESDDSDADDQIFNRGDIVWAMYARTYYPAKVVGKDDVPEQHQKQLFAVVSKQHVVVMWFGENKYSRVLTTRISPLAESREDSQRAAKPEILVLYNMALAELRND